VKATARVEESVFKPITVSVTLETQGDVDAFYALFNHETTRIACRWSPEQTRNIRESVRFAHGGEPKGQDEIHARLVNR
jgi:hypothetical protein